MLIHLYCCCKLERQRILKDTHAWFIDYRKPFDCVSHIKPLNVLRRIRTPKHLLVLM